MSSLSLLDTEKSRCGCRAEIFCSTEELVTFLAKMLRQLPFLTSTSAQYYFKKWSDVLFELNPALVQRLQNSTPEVCLTSVVARTHKCIHERWCELARITDSAESRAQGVDYGLLNSTSVSVVGVLNALMYLGDMLRGQPMRASNKAGYTRVPSYGEYGGYDVEVFSNSFDIKHLPGRAAVMITDGGAHLSNLVKHVTETESYFTHAVLLYEDEAGEVWAVEALDKTVKRPWKEFLKKEKPMRFAIFTVRDIEVQNKVERIVDKFVQEAIGVPYGFRGENGTRACINVVNDLYIRATGSPIIDIRSRMKAGAGNEARLRDLGVLLDSEQIENFECIMPQTALVAPALRLEALARNASKLDEIHMRSATAGAMVAAMQDALSGYGYVLRYGKFLSMVSRVLAEARRFVPIPSIPQGVKSETISHLLLSEIVWKKLLKCLRNKNASQIRSRGVSMSYIEMKEYLSKILMNDREVWRTGGASIVTHHFMGRNSRRAPLHSFTAPSYGES